MDSYKLMNDRVVKATTTHQLLWELWVCTINSTFFYCIFSLLQLLGWLPRNSSADNTSEAIDKLQYWLQTGATVRLLPPLTGRVATDCSYLVVKPQPGAWRNQSWGDGLDVVTINQVPTCWLDKSHTRQSTGKSSQPTLWHFVLETFSANSF